MTLLNSFALLWELARFNTTESMLQWFAALWGACLAAADSDQLLEPRFVARILIANITTMTLVHGAACTWNDFIDKDIDAKIERTKYRPVASGRVKPSTAIYSYIILLAFSGLTTYGLLGTLPLRFLIINHLIYLVYPFMKRTNIWPQVVVSPAVGCPALYGWVSVTGDTGSLSKCMPLFLAVSIWTIYFDTAYGFQDAIHDVEIGVSSLAVWSGAERIHKVLAVLGLGIISSLAVSAYTSGASLAFWLLGVLIWACEIPRQIGSLDVKNPSSGDRVFRRNISLGAYMSMISVLELSVQSWKRY